MVKQREAIILGISLGTKRMGVAVLSFGNLIHWQLHTFHGVWSEVKERGIIDCCIKCVQKYGVKRVFIKIPPYTHHSPGVESLLRSIIRCCSDCRCDIQYATKQRLKHEVPEVTNPRSLMQYVTNRYPVLQLEHDKALLQRYPYGIKMFEAVLVADYCKRSVRP